MCKQDAAPFTTLSLSCNAFNVPEFIEPENWPPNRPDLNLADYLVWTALQQMVQRHKISDTDQLKQVLIDSWTRRSQDTPNQAIDQLPKRLKMVIKGKSGNVEFCLDWPYVLEIALVLLYFEWKLNKTDASLSNPTQFWRHWRFMQIRQRMFNCTDMQIMYFTLDKILKHLTFAFLSLVVAKLSDF